MKKVLFFIFAGSLALLSCDSDNDGSDNDNPRQFISLTRSEEEMAVKHVDFAFNFFKAVEKSLADKGQTEGRVAVSPLSASFAASMLANGTAGETQREVLDVLGFTNYPMDEVNAYNEKLVKQLVSIDKKSQVKIANSFWLNEGFEPLSTFAQTLQESYDAEVKRVDFATALPDINRWCSEKTGGKIPNFLSHLDERASFVLLNALYYKGEWTKKFDKTNNSNEDFTDSQGTALNKVTYMNATLFLPCAQTERYAIASLPFGNRAYRLVVLLPNLGVSVEECLGDLDSDGWNECLGAMGSYEKEVSVKLPKFKIDFKADIKQVLKDMGMNLLFTPTMADFSSLARFAEGDELLLEASQACTVEVDEEGATAAAVTNLSGLVTSVGPMEQSTFHVTRPFLFFITEQSTGTILFMGRVSKVE